jgi:hypothetical protein
VNISLWTQFSIRLNSFDAFRRFPFLEWSDDFCWLCSVKFIQKI